MTTLVVGLRDNRRADRIGSGFRELSCRFSRTSPEYQDLRKRIRPETVCAVDTHTCAFAGGEQPRQRSCAVDVRRDSAHHVVNNRPHWYEIGYGIQPLVLEAKLAHERKLLVDQPFAKMT